MSIERDIHHDLMSSLSPTEVAAKLSTQWQSEDPSLADKETIANFLLHVGQIRTLLEIFKQSLADSKTIPWAQFLETIKAAGIEVDHEMMATILEGATAQDLKSQLLNSFAFDAVMPALISLRNDARKAARQILEDQRNALLEKLEYLRTQRMFEEEGKVLNELLALFPEGDFAAIKKDYDERWAREIVAQRSSSPPTRAPQIHQTKSAEYLEAEKWLAQEVQAAAEQNAHLRYDYSILLYFMELFSPAIQILKSAKPSKSVDWLRLELLIKARQYVEALELAKDLGTKYANDPTSTFAVIYARAQAMHGLGQKEDALQLLQSIIRIRPNYRSAQILFRDWSGGES